MCDTHINLHTVASYHKLKALTRHELVLLFMALEQECFSLEVSYTILKRFGITIGELAEKRKEDK